MTSKLVTHTKIVILQVANECNERKNRVSSVNVLRNVLQHVLVVNADREFANLSEIFMLPTTAILYPSDKSEELLNVMSHEVKFDCSSECTRNSTQIDTLVVIDGSWVTVQELIGKQAILQKIRHVRLPANIVEHSIYEVYGLRKEPCRGFLSTAEAVAHALHILEHTNDSIHPCATILSEFEKFVVSRVGVEDSTTHRIPTHQREFQLLPSKGIKEKTTITKGEKRQNKRRQEHRRRRHE